MRQNNTTSQFERAKRIMEIESELSLLRANRPHIIGSDRSGLSLWTPEFGQRNYERNMKKITDKKKLNEIFKRLDKEDQIRKAGLCIIEKDQTKTIIYR